MKVKLTYLLLSTCLLIFLLNSCKKDETLNIEEEIKNKTWTQKTGFFNGVDLGSIKTIYQMTFYDNGYCSMIWDRLIGGYPMGGDTLSSGLDTLNLKYTLGNSKILFPETFDELILSINGSTDTLNAYFNDYEIVSFEENLIHLKYIVNSDTGMVYFGPKEMYLEPF